MKRRQWAARTAPERRSWSSPWLAQQIGPCGTCERRCPVMVIEDDALVCSDCHERRLEKWREEDRAAELMEALWSVWNSMF